MSRSAARVEVDAAESLIVSGASTVFVNSQPSSIMGSVTSDGYSIVQGAGTVFVENQPIARSGDLSSSGTPIGGGSQDVFADK
jgi:uncharacterized Zn-binding protein involved in type VI secretion